MKVLGTDDVPGTGKPSQPKPDEGDGSDGDKNE